MSSRSRQASTGIATVLVVALAMGCASGGSRGGTRPSRANGANGATAVSTVTAEDIANVRVARIEEFLMGRVPGLQVFRTGDGEYTMRIRGAASFRGNDEPLIVIDGMPVLAGTASRALSHVDPATVARVEVLKDAGALASYGVQGGNGVILITTRRQ
jgi:TonB-dependent SusC/RagA subfamily outer membrane receptor